MIVMIRGKGEKCALERHGKISLDEEIVLYLDCRDYMHIKTHRAIH